MHDQTMPTVQCPSEAPRSWRQAAAKAVIHTFLLGSVEDWAHSYWTLSKLHHNGKRVLPSSDGAYGFISTAVVVSEAHEQASGDTSVEHFPSRKVEIVSNIRHQKKSVHSMWSDLLRPCRCG